MQNIKLLLLPPLLCMLHASDALAQHHPTPDEDQHEEAPQHTQKEREPSLPEGMTLEQTLALAAKPPPEHFPQALHDDMVLGFFLWDQLEYRAPMAAQAGMLGWEGNAWLGGDFNRVVLKPQGEVELSEPRALETENDLLYSRLIAPFWSAQAGVQYANSWALEGAYEDRWSAALAIQGIAPGKFEVDASVYLSQALALTGELEVEYDWRLTQRLVLQPRVELALAIQDIPERQIGAGISDISAGLRLRYELKRELAPYLGVQYQARTFESADRTRAAGGDPRQFMALAGLRFAFL